MSEQAQRLLKYADKCSVCGREIPAGTPLDDLNWDRKGNTRSHKVEPAGAPPPPEASAGFKTADQLPATPAPGAAPPVPAVAEEEDSGPLTPVAVMTDDERRTYGIAETETAVVRGTKWTIVPELGMPAKYVFARISLNRRTNRTEVRLFPSIEGLMFRANAFADGIRKLTWEYVEAKDIPGLSAFLEETHDPQLIVRAHVTLGNGAEIVEEGSVRLSEIKLFQSKRSGRMVSRSPVGRTNPIELAKKRALARALRWGTGFGGTALDELPPAESEDAREKAGLKGGPAALPPAESP